MGPDTYDVASLLRDRGVARILGEETELELVDYYADWRVHGLPARTELPQGERRSMRRRYFETLLQRSLKILGTFSKQPLARGRMWYLDFIPPTLESVHRCLDELPEYGALASLLPMDFSVATARERAERIHRWLNTRSRFFPVTASAPRSRPRWSRSSNAPASTSSGRSTSSAPRRISRFGDPLPPEVLESILRNKVALKGPVTTPIGTGFSSINVRLRKTLDLYANLRPVKSMPNIITRFENVDIIVVRENTEDLYSGLEHEVVPGVVESIKIITEKASTRIAKFAFEYARTHGRKRVTAVHKANIMKLSDGLFLQCFRNVAKEYPNIEADDKIVDNLCMQMVMNPKQFDVLLLENLYGDIVSDLAAGLVGGLGVVAGANIGENGAVFEAVHGSAPDIAGQNKANPLALLQVRRADAASHRRDGRGQTDRRRDREGARLRPRTSHARHRRHRHDRRLHDRDVRDAAPRHEGGRLNKPDFVSPLSRRPRSLQRRRVLGCA